MPDPENFDGHLPVLEQLLTSVNARKQDVPTDAAAGVAA